MADYQIFIVNNVDYTPYLRTQDYEVTRQDVFDTWVDGNHITRANVLRTRLTGTIHMVLNATDWQDFLADWEAVKNPDGTVTVRVHPNNTPTATLVSANVYGTVTAKVVYGTAPYQYQPTAMDVTISIEEA